MRSHPIAALLLAAAALTVAACEEPAERVSAPPPPTPSAAPSTPNAAAEYMRLAEELGPSYMDPFSEFVDMTSLTPSVEAALEALQPQIRGLIEASRIARCDFEVDYGDGPATLLPHLAKVRGMARLLRADALRLTRQQDRVGAAERLAAIIRIGRHFAGGRIIIEKLVGLAIVNLACSTIDELLERKVLDARGTPILLAELLEIDPRDPLDAKAAVAGEREITAAAIRNDRGFDVVMGRAWSMIPDSEHAALAEDFERVMERLEAAWDRPSEMEDIEAGVSDPKVRMLLAGVAKYRVQVERIGNRIEETIAALQ